MSVNENLGPQFRKGDIVEHLHAKSGSRKRIRLDVDSEITPSGGIKITGRRAFTGGTGAVSTSLIGYPREMRKIES